MLRRSRIASILTKEAKSVNIPIPPIALGVGISSLLGAAVSPKGKTKEETIRNQVIGATVGSAVGFVGAAGLSSKFVSKLLNLKAQKGIRLELGKTLPKFTSKHIRGYFTGKDPSKVKLNTAKKMGRSNG